MRLLLNTHVLLWFLAVDPKLSTTAKAAIEDPANELCLSPFGPDRINHERHELHERTSNPAGSGGGDMADLTCKQNYSIITHDYINIYYSSLDFSSISCFSWSNRFQPG